MNGSGWKSRKLWMLIGLLVFLGYIVVNLMSMGELKYMLSVIGFMTAGVFSYCGFNVFQNIRLNGTNK